MCNVYIQVYSRGKQNVLHCIMCWVIQVRTILPRAVEYNVPVLPRGSVGTMQCILLAPGRPIRGQENDNQSGSTLSRVGGSRVQLCGVTRYNAWVLRFVCPYCLGTINDCVFNPHQYNYQAHDVTVK